MKYKLVAVDIDGTLIGEDIVIWANTRRALHQCDRQGVTVTLPPAVCSSQLNPMPKNSAFMFH